MGTGSSVSGLVNPSDPDPEMGAELSVSESMISALDLSEDTGMSPRERTDRTELSGLCNLNWIDSFGPTQCVGQSMFYKESPVSVLKAHAT